MSLPSSPSHSHAGASARRGDDDAPARSAVARLVRPTDHGSGVHLVYVARDSLAARELAAFCAGHGIDVTWIASLPEALAAGALRTPDLLHVCDAGSTPEHVEALRALRVAHPQAFLVFETWRMSTASQVRLLDMGVDAVVATPCPVELLLAFARKVGRSKPSAVEPRPGRRFRIGETVVDLDARTAMRAGVLLRLTPRESQALDALAARAEQPVGRAELSQLLWQRYHPSSRSLDMLLVALRRKLEAQPSQPRHLVTVPGAGYSLRHVHFDV